MEGEERTLDRIQGGPRIQICVAYIYILEPPLCQNISNTNDWCSPFKPEAVLRQADRAWGRTRMLMSRGPQVPGYAAGLRINNMYIKKGSVSIVALHSSSAAIPLPR